jgi:hypothetical protein
VIEIPEEAWKNTLTLTRKVAEEKPKVEAATSPQASPGTKKPRKP